MGGLAEITSIGIARCGCTSAIVDLCRRPSGQGEYLDIRRFP
jgi:hypothetical protein